MGTWLLRSDAWLLCGPSASQDAIYDYSGAFCSLEEPPGVTEFPEVHPSGEHHHPDADTITKLAWH